MPRGGYRPGAGRPPDVDGEPRRAKRLELRLTEDERAAIEGAAERSGETLADWSRRVLLRASKGRRT